VSGCRKARSGSWIVAFLGESGYDRAARIERTGAVSRSEEGTLNAIGYFEIQADRPEAAVAFYREAFGWRFTRLESVPIPYWSIETDGIRGGLLQRPAQPPPAECGTNAYVCSIEVADIDAMSATILRLGGRVALPKFAVPGVCWHAYFVDPDGNTFGLFQPDPAAG
jgi:predicted enzyme related to lactoylglutathione lyase